MSEAAVVIVVAGVAAWSEAAVVIVVAGVAACDSPHQWMAKARSNSCDVVVGGRRPGKENDGKETPKRRNGIAMGLRWDGEELARRISLR